MIYDWNKLPKDLDVDLMKKILPLIQEHGYRKILKHVAEWVHIDLMSMTSDNGQDYGPGVANLVKVRNNLDNLYIETSNANV